MVKISSPVDLDHKGFLLRVVTSSGRRGGRWAVDRSLQRYNPECGVTHRDPRSRPVTTVLWRSPSAVLGSLGNIQFKAIVVANMSVFWDNILSHSISPAYPDASIATARRYQRIFDILDVVSDKTNREKPAQNRDKSAAVSSAAVAGEVKLAPSTRATLSTVSPAGEASVATTL
ncbi:hypothetical protein RRG08_033165 [Elysia crispata]|uniref:Reelin domain-containing protein n=1 Tax=Elysia crispata TaxID=231223 RepID=A0AAE0YXV6_9GAST|nr:hypothetical protein RRG08_033165 [Elysia crispata]